MKYPAGVAHVDHQGPRLDKDGLEGRLEKSNTTARVCMAADDYSRREEMGASDNIDHLDVERGRGDLLTVSADLKH